MGLSSYVFFVHHVHTIDRRLENSVVGWKELKKEKLIFFMREILRSKLAIISGYYFVTCRIHSL